MSTETPETILAAADAGITEADAELQALEARVIDGDTTITPDQIEQARQGRWWAGLQRKQAEKKAAALAEAQATQARTVAFLETRRILDETTQAAVDNALKTAAEAMAALRETVRRHNENRARAVQVLARCPAVEPSALCPPGTSVQNWTPPAIGYATLSSGQWALWVDHESVPVLDEAWLMDQARKAPANADQEAAQAAQTRAKARLIEQDADLYQQDRPAFEQLPAYRRKPALDRLGVDWDSYARQREKTHELEPLRRMRDA